MRKKQNETDSKRIENIDFSHKIAYTMGEQQELFIKCVATLSANP